MVLKARNLFVLYLLLSLVLECSSSFENTDVLNKNSHTTRFLQDKDNGSGSSDADQDTLVETVTSEKTLIDSSLLDIVWCGEKQESVLVLSENGTVYYSDNGGQTWKNIRNTLYKTAKKEVSDTESIGDVDRVMQSPVDAQLIFFLGVEGVNWYSEDCGKTITAMNTGRNIKEFQFHPLEKNWILASSFTSCDDFDDEPCRIFKEVYYSKNLGQDWTFVADYVIQFSWGVQDWSFLSSVPNERIIICHELNKQGSQRKKGWSKHAEIAYSDDFFKTKKTALANGNKFLITGNYFFAIQVEDGDPDEVTFLLSNSRYSDYIFKIIELPSKSKKLLEHSYTILDTSEGQVFLHLTQEGDKAKYGNIYISDSTGERYSLSLKNHVRYLDGQCDFEKVSGLEGIYFANIYDPLMVKKIKSEYSAPDEIPQEKTTNRPTSSRKPFETNAPESKTGGKRAHDLDEYKQTKITFDKGAIWEPLTPPKKDARGRNIECEDDSCALHLHSISNQRFGPFYSTESSLGIILGVGNVGRYLSNREDEVSTYLSRDGGKTWYEIRKGSHIYEIGDHGALIVVAPDQQADKYIYFTWNEGLTWSKMKISETPIQITNIIIEPTNTAQKFILYGRTKTLLEGNVTKQQGVLVHIDFSSLHERVCEFPDKPDDPASDYETWSPNGKISKNCLMGHQTTYVRRKREAQCYNHEEFDRWYSYRNCECTEEDWECDTGYERKNEGPCLPSSNFTPSYDPPAECRNFYYISNGYRKVSGNTCQGGATHEGMKMPCPKEILTRKNMILLILVAIASAVIWLISAKGTAIVGSLRSLITRKPSASAPNKKDFEKIKQDEFGDADEDHEYFPEELTNIDKKESSPIQLDDRSESSTGKKMTERKGLETASRNIPAINKPK